MLNPEVCDLCYANKYGEKCDSRPCRELGDWTCRVWWEKGCQGVLNENSDPPEGCEYLLEHSVAKGLGNDALKRKENRA